MNKEIKMKKEKNNAYIPPKVDEDEILVIKVGTKEFPAGPKDIENVQMLFSQAAKDPNLCIVTHHAIKFVVLKKANLKNIITCCDIEKVKNIKNKN